MITFSKIKTRLGAALNDLGEALTAALAWIEEGEAFQPFATVSKQAKLAVLAPVSRLERSLPAR